MATTATNGNLIPLTASPSGVRTRTATRAATQRRRKMTPEAGRAIEMLGHAIEYLGDEFALDCMMDKTEKKLALVNPWIQIDPRVEAIQMLMACNREVYLSCPEIPTLGERLRSMLSLQRS